MRIDSAGIYTNRGLIQGKAFPPKTDQMQGIKSTEAKNQSVQTQKTSKPWQPVNFCSLSAEESAKISHLFGQFDPSALSLPKSVSGMDKRPGIFVDIMV